MNSEYKKDFSISYTDSDRKIQLSLVNAISLVQNMVTEYFEMIGSDNIVLKRENNALWVLAKTKVHFNRHPEWKEKIKGSTFTSKISPIRVETETEFTDEYNNILFYAKQETCAIDIDTRKIRKINTVNYPLDIETKSISDDLTYSKLNDEFTEKDKAYEQIVYSTDIDYSGHTNNVIYVRHVLNSLSCEFLDNCEITDFEIHYINETREGQNIKIYRKIKENEVLFLIKEGERDIIKAKLNYIKLDKKQEK